jgi:hypothetical protein
MPFCPIKHDHSNGPHYALHATNSPPSPAVSLRFPQLRNKSTATQMPRIVTQLSHTHPQMVSCINSSYSHPHHGRCSGPSPPIRTSITSSQRILVDSTRPYGNAACPSPDGMRPMGPHSVSVGDDKKEWTGIGSSYREQGEQRWEEAGGHHHGRDGEYLGV